ncbi:MAG TPA: fluoride efflux transporter CrcB [Acetobacteraceae bacterium]|nr:fluoride efflux transporter CrcB [Acetobacteraceae bacterium]
MIRTLAALAVFGTLGCWARYFQAIWVQNLLGQEFPYAIFSINVIGSFLMGFLFILTLERLAVSPPLRVGVLTGFVGGYTTFSTFEMETLLLMQHGQGGKAALYVALSVGLGLLAAFFGAYLARSI